MQIPKFQLGLGSSMEFTEPEREKLGIYAPGKEPEGGKKKGNLGTRRERVDGVCLCV